MSISYSTFSCLAPNKRNIGLVMVVSSAQLCFQVTDNKLGFYLVWLLNQVSLNSILTSFFFFLIQIFQSVQIISLTMKINTMHDACGMVWVQKNCYEFVTALHRIFTLLIETQLAHMNNKYWLIINSK